MNNFYREICEIHGQLSDPVDANDSLLSIMAASMKGKFDKYWGDVDNINPLLFLSDLLDPRYELRYLKYCFESIYDGETVAKIVVQVESILQHLYAANYVKTVDVGSQVIRSLRLVYCIITSLQYYLLVIILVSCSVSI